MGSLVGYIPAPFQVFLRSRPHGQFLLRSQKSQLDVCLLQGGRGVLYLYGYTNQQLDGLSFPDDVADPDVDKVAAVTLEVMTLRAELDMLIKVRV